MNGKVWNGKGLVRLKSDISLGGRGTYGQSQGPTALGVNEEEGRNRRHDLDRTVSQRGEKGLISSVADILEDGGAVEGDNCDDD